MAGPVTIRKSHGLPRQRPVTTSDITDFDDDVSEPTDLKLLKEVSERLNLATRRPSTVQWKQVIEFRKSMGLYSSDVEPEFLDKIVEAKMKSDADKTASPKSSPSLKGKFFPRKEKEAKSTKDDEINNNNVKTKVTRTWRSKSEKSVKGGESVAKKNGFSLPSFQQHKDKSKPKKARSKVSTKSKKAPEIAITRPPEETVQVPTSVDEKEADISISDPTRCEVAVVSTADGDKQAQCPEEVARPPLYDTDDENEEDTKGMSDIAIRYRNITRTLGKIRRDLIIMRMEDSKLARKLLDARSEINLIKVHQSCDAHAEMLDDVTYEMEEDDLLPGLIKACDLPSRPPGSLLIAFSPLRNIGLSRMNLNRRRFSIR